MNHLLGAVAALGAAAAWAVSAMLFQRIGTQLTPLITNLSKGLVALLAMSFLLLFADWRAPDWPALLALACSGLVGIAFGDTLYFHTLNRLGPRLTLMVTTLVPVATAVAAVIVFREMPSIVAWLGLFCVLGSVAYVLWEKHKSSVQAAQHVMSGIVFAAVYVLAETAGMLLTKFGVQEFSALEANWWRQCAATLGLGIWLGALPAPRRLLAPLQERAVWRPLLAAGVIGAFIGTWCTVIALKYTYAAVAATLSSTSPLFILPMVAIFNREPISRRALLASLVAVCGVAVYFFAQN